MTRTQRVAWFLGSVAADLEHLLQVRGQGHCHVPDPAGSGSEMWAPFAPHVYPPHGGTYVLYAQVFETSRGCDLTSSKWQKL